ncbi:MAG TPA: radical SAM protein, partial [Planctomycetota bacterium]|nr:radical SAM protein [Planctomycetota bacterium]
MRRFDRETESSRERELLSALAEGGGLSEVPPFPLKVQVQTKTLCNAACTMCPYPVVEGSLEHGEMALPLYDLLLGQLVGRGVERLSLFLMNEPLLDRRLPEFVRRAKARLPGTATVIFTNGSALTERCARALHAAGLDEIDLSVHGFDRAAYESVMVGLSFERLRSNLRRLLSMRRAGELPGLKVKLVAVDLSRVLGSLEDRDRELFADVLVKATSNEREAVAAGAGPAPRRRPCQRPFVKAYVLHN